MPLKSSDLQATELHCLALIRYDKFVDSVRIIRAKNNYEANYDSDISFRKGDILQLINEKSVIQYTVIWSCSRPMFNGQILLGDLKFIHSLRRFIFIHSFIQEFEYSAPSRLLLSSARLKRRVLRLE